MKITQKSGISPQKKTQRKQSTSSHFSDFLITEQQTETKETSSHTQPRVTPDTPQESYKLFEQASELLDQALAPLETGIQPDHETYESLQKIRGELEALSELNHDQGTLSQAKTLLAVEAQRIQTMKH